MSAEGEGGLAVVSRSMKCRLGTPVIEPRLGNTGQGRSGDGDRGWGTSPRRWPGADPTDGAPACWRGSGLEELWPRAGAQPGKTRPRRDDERKARPGRS
jgi:hypothetical protein